MDERAEQLSRHERPAPTARKEVADIQLHIGPKEVLQLQHSADQFGFASIDQAIDAALFDSLRVEAADQRGVASIAKESQNIAYQAYIATLGQAARLFLESRSTANLLQSVFNQRFVLTPEASCYTYYECGNFLGLHLDRESECAVTLILYLDVRRPDKQVAQTGLQLRVYSLGADQQPMIRQVIPSRIGTLVVGRGSKTWHERPTLQKGEYLAALTACFKQNA